MIECSFCYNKAIRYLRDDDTVVSYFAACDRCSLDKNLWDKNLEISESEYLLYLAMDKL